MTKSWKVVNSILTTIIAHYSFFVPGGFLEVLFMLLSINFLQETLSDVHFFTVQQGVLQPVVELAAYDGANTHVGVAIDSQLLEAGDVFVALAGRKVDGHSFIAQALERGAVAVMVNHCDWVTPEHRLLLENKLIIQVADTYAALCTLARAWRARFTIPIIGITGSIGKTTTKEMLRVLLQEAGIPAHVSLKNQNTVLGLCMNMLKLHPDHQAAIFEVGVSLSQEMAERAELLQPTLGVITMVANAHAEGLGGIQGIAREKRALFRHFGPHAIGIINGDQALLANAYYSHPIAKFGVKMKNQVQARRIMSGEVDGHLRTQFLLKWYGEIAPVTLHNCHAGYVNNALAAATVAYFLKIPLATIVRGLEAYRGFEDRFEFRKLKNDSGRLISDCYNANPESMRAALAAFSAMQSIGPKIAVLGDMLELGEKESYWHRQLGRLVRKDASLTTVILVGQRAHLAQTMLPSALDVVTANDWQEAAEHLSQRLSKHSLVLVKASRGMNLTSMVQIMCDK